MIFMRIHDFWVRDVEICLYLTIPQRYWGFQVTLDNWICSGLHLRAAAPSNKATCPCYRHYRVLGMAGFESVHMG